MKSLRKKIDDLISQKKSKDEAEEVEANKRREQYLKKMTDLNNILRTQVFNVIEEFAPSLRMKGIETTVKFSEWNDEAGNDPEVILCVSGDFISKFQVDQSSLSFTGHAHQETIFVKFEFRGTELAGGGEKYFHTEPSQLTKDYVEKLVFQFLETVMN